MTNHQLNCPNCAQVDQVQKVSSIFSSGVTTGTYSGPSTSVGVPVGKGQTTVTGGYTTLSGSSQSLMSSRLAPPAKPSAEGRSCWATGCALGLLGWGGLAAFLAVGWLIAGIAEISSRGMPNAGGMQEGLGLILGQGFWAAVCIGGGIAIFRSTGKSAKKRAEEAAAQMPKWETAITRWNRLYYCARCDGIFEPGENVFLPPEQMMNHIYR